MRVAAFLAVAGLFLAACSPPAPVELPADSGLDVPDSVQGISPVPDAPSPEVDPARSLAAAAAVVSGNALEAQLSGHVLPTEMEQAATLVLDEALLPLLRD